MDSPLETQPPVPAAGIESHCAKPRGATSFNNQAFPVDPTLYNAQAEAMVERNMSKMYFLPFI